CYLNMGNVVHEEGKYEASMEWYERAIVFNYADSKKAYNNLGVALTRLGRLDEAVEKLKKAVEIDPRYYEAYNNIGETYKYLGNYEKALESCEEAIRLSPEFVPARWNRSMLFLLKGQFEKGWTEYEWRWQRPNTPKRKIDAGMAWDGNFFKGKTIFVYEEQGMGDTLQFIRYLPLVKQMGGHVIFEVLTPMIRLVESVKGFDRLWVGIRNVDTRPSDRFDFHIPLMSLPRIFNTTLKTVPADIPYLTADQNLAQIWKKRIKKNSSFKIGIVWAGHPGHTNDGTRSTYLSLFSVLKQVKGIALFSLQIEKYEKWTDINPRKIIDQDLGEQISDFADTAAIIENLDLVISVDTAIVHLAGALGKQVWTLLPFSPDWRWMIDQEDSPWYPTMKLFRQPAPGDWKSVFKKVKKHLATQIKQKK
ncbi:MAG: tetratricopeptide repeat-containing glycosyltransferase family protein, partial [Proteobacteria bacterium]|nr:tetratricopeptide repeat-containing glycosyltransferase family protein [Pseudomonadota bacterium]MBU1582251.1 tetratricopeptide repeat-containing glycosyltransferase family protein [Pseudomonadota bacterium]MBU2452429.1 tetratricopeptide repeat-containing glycosyltransferase family protein [Pseudomonadota bacterium]